MMKLNGMAGRWESVTMGCSNLRSLPLSPDLVGTICTVICMKWPQPISFTLRKIIHF